MVPSCRIQPQSKALAAALLLAVLTVEGIVTASEDLRPVYVLSALLLILAAGIAFRMRWSRVIGAIVFWLLAVQAAMGVAQNVFVVLAISPLGWLDFVALGASAIACAATIAAAVWLGSAQARMYYLG